MSLSLSFGDLSSITVKAMGSGSKILYDCKIGDSIGIRGPYGSHFDLMRKMKRVLLVGGGTGTVPVIMLAKSLAKLRPIEGSMVIGAKTRDEMPFLGASKRFLGKENVFPATNDGTFGFRGLAHEKVDQLIRRKKFDMIFSCGPEKMMHEVYRIAKKNKVPVQFSLERIMKCGIGICGSCCIGDYVLCKDGPVLGEEDLDRIMPEFGISTRDKSGTLVSQE